jgi:hypothetical protein
MMITGGKRWRLDILASASLPLVPASKLSDYPDKAVGGNASTAAGQHRSSQCRDPIDADDPGGVLGLALRECGRPAAANRAFDTPRLNEARSAPLRVIDLDMLDTASVGPQDHLSMALDRGNVRLNRSLPSVGDSTHHSGTQIALSGRPSAHGRFPKTGSRPVLYPGASRTHGTRMNTVLNDECIFVFSGLLHCFLKMIHYTTGCAFHL